MDQNYKDILDKLNEVAVSQSVILTKQDAHNDILEKHASLLERQNETLIRNTATVEEHHKRSTYLETEQKRLEADLASVKHDVTFEQQKKKWRKEMITLGTMITTGLTTLAGIFWAVYEFFKKLGV